MTTKFTVAFLWARTLFNQLWLSVSSVRFYQDIYKSYQGYGTKYLLTVTFLSSLIYCLFIFNYLIKIKDYFVNNHLTSSITTIDYILKQLPEIYYDGNKIIVDQEEPIYLFDQNSNKIVAIDSKNQLSYTDRMKTPIIFSSHNITLATMEITDRKKSNFSIEYPTFFNSKEQSLTEEVIKERFSKILRLAPTIFIYLIVPFIVFVRFISILFEKSFVILLVYVLTSFFGPKSSLQSCSRMVLFASGVPLLLQPIITIFLPEINVVIFLLQMLANLLLFLGILRLRNNHPALL